MNEFTLVLGTHNAKKKGELVEILAPHGVRLRTLAEFPEPLTVEESGQTFAANARLKASQQARHLQHWVLGEDSGLSVDALQGAPGVYSARYAGEGANDASNNALLLDRLRGVPWSQRTAFYTCHVAVSDPQGVIRWEVEAYCRGRILEKPRGEGGFGYDPLFEIAEYHRTFAELGSAVKAVLSHRGRALRQLLPQLIQWLDAARPSETQGP